MTVQDILDRIERGDTMPEEVDVLAQEIARLRALLDKYHPKWRKTERET